MRGIKSDSLGFGSKSKLDLKSDRRGLRRARGGGEKGSFWIWGVKEKRNIVRNYLDYVKSERSRLKCGPDPYHFFDTTFRHLLYWQNSSKHGWPSRFVS
jgi:hypothetical protein